jgi:CBS domain-containing protein
MKVTDILKVKGDGLYTASPQTSMRDAISIMTANDIGSLVVMQDGQVCGMLSFREVMNAIDVESGAVRDGTVNDHMATDFDLISPDTDLNDIRRRMLERHSRYVPVVDGGGTLMGVLSFYDIAKAVLDAQSFENQLLKAYIREWPAETEE